MQSAKKARSRRLACLRSQRQPRSQHGTQGQNHSDRHFDARRIILRQRQDHAIKGGGTGRSDRFQIVFGWLTESWASVSGGIFYAARPQPVSGAAITQLLVHRLTHQV